MFVVSFNIDNYNIDNNIDNIDNYKVSSNHALSLSQEENNCMTFIFVFIKFAGVYRGGPVFL